MAEGQFKSSDLPIVDGRTYHLDLRPEELAENIIIVGDPDRVSFIADEFLGTKEIDRFHRGLRTITGRVKDTGQRVSIVTSGMGTPSLEIVLNEIVALNEIDFHTKERRAEYDTLTIIRVGTSGGLQPDTELGASVITAYAVGLDNTGLFYDAPYPEETLRMLEDAVGRCVDGAITDHSRFKGRIFPYASKAHNDVVDALEREAWRLGVRYKKGGTVSNSGFFANQGRTISRVPLTIPGIETVLACVDTGMEGLKIENMEMEASFLLYFMGALGYRAGAICPIIDKRGDNKFLSEYAPYIRDATRVALGALNRLK
ncbi:MAG: nucleoside phosphorylase [Thermodesulfobacteriota bacterium]